MFDFLRNTPIDHTVVATNHVIRALEYREDLFKSLDPEDDRDAFFGLSDDERAVALSIADEIRTIEGLPFGYLTAETASTYTTVLAGTVQEIIHDQLSRDDIRGGGEFLQRWQTSTAEPRNYLPRDDSRRLTFLLTGLGIGALIALLFAPKSGDEIRSDIADATREGIDRSRKAAQALVTKARQQSGEYYDDPFEAVEEYYEPRRDDSRSQAGSLSAAVEAAKKAYIEQKRKAELSGHTEAAPIYKPDHVS
jgi:gas vesicle protein